MRRIRFARSLASVVDWHGEDGEDGEAPAAIPPPASFASSDLYGYVVGVRRSLSCLQGPLCRLLDFDFMFSVHASAVADLLATCHQM